MINKTTAHKISQEYFKAVAAMLTNAFGLVAALAWNETVKEIIDRYIPGGSALYSKLIYALIVTALAVTMAIWLGRLASRLDKQEEKNEK